jgi:hypothetical protein
LPELPPARVEQIAATQWTLIDDEYVRRQVEREVCERDEAEAARLLRTPCLSEVMRVLRGKQSNILFPVDYSTIIDVVESDPDLEIRCRSAFRQLKQSMFISASHTLLLQLPDSSFMEDAAAREVLQLKGAKAKITPAQVSVKAGDGSLLWVQSTSRRQGKPSRRSFAVQRAAVSRKVRKASGRVTEANTAAASTSPSSSPLLAKSRVRTVAQRDDHPGQGLDAGQETVSARKRSKMQVDAADAS